MESVPVVRLAGEFDIYTADRLAEALRPIEDRGIVDLSDVRYLDSAGLTQLVRLAKRCGLRRVVLVAPDPGIRYILATTNFEQLFILVDRFEDAQAVS